MCDRTCGWLCLLAGLSAMLAGCGGGASDVPKTVPAKGVVTYQGQPLPKVVVAFIPDKGKLATGSTDDQGRFTLTTNTPGDGAMVGTYKVAINVVTDEIPSMFPEENTKKAANLPFPKKYTDPKTSDLMITVSQDAAQNDFKIELTD